MSNEQLVKKPETKRRRGEEAKSYSAASHRNSSSTRLPSPRGTRSGFFIRGAGGEGNLRHNIWFLLLCILLLATFLRFYQLPHLPPGLNFDEAGNGAAALEILRGEPKLWWRIGGGKEPVWPYIVALGTLAWGNIPLTLRYLAAAIGILTVAASYPLLAVLYKRQKAVAIFTMLGLAVSGWHLHFSRLGFRAILLPLFSTLAFCFFWRQFSAADNAGKKGQVTNAVLSALFLALAIYSYLGARLLPVVIVLFMALYWLASRFKPDNRPDFKSHLIFTLQLFIALFIFLLPLIVHFAVFPTDFLARSTTVSIFNPAWNNGDLPGTVWQTVTLTLGTFFGLTGDSNPLVNLPGQPAIPITLAVLFAVGLVVSLYRMFAQPLTRAASYLFLLCWWLVMLLPAILAPEGAPHHLRLIGTLAPTYGLVAVGGVAVVNLLVNFGRREGRSVDTLARVGYLILATTFLLVAGQTYTNYFLRWPQSTDFTLPFDLYATRLAAQIDQSPDNTIYVLPMDIRADIEARHYTLDYLIPNGDYVYIPVDEKNAETTLARAAAGKETIQLVRWTADKHHQADAKEIVTFLMETNAQPAGRETYPVYDIETYTLPKTTQAACQTGNGDCFTLPVINQPIGTNFDNLLRLDAAYLAPTANPGGWLPVALTLAPLAPMDTDYKASLRLTNSTGQRVAQKDRVLLHNFHQGTSLWPQESVNEYYLLPIPADAPAGEYTATVVLYHPDTQAPLVADGVVEVPLGYVTIE